MTKILGCYPLDWIFCIGYNRFVESQSSPPVRSFLFTAVLFGLLGWGGLVVLFTNTLPTIGPRWLFFFLFFIGLTGTALPFTAFLNRRFPSTAPAPGSVILRQAIWIGIYGSAIAWLQIGRVLTVSLALLLAIGLALIEWLLRMRERSQWQP